MIGNYQALNVPVSKVIDYMGGNSGLTEQFIYSLINGHNEGKYKVITGSMDTVNVERMNLCASPKNPDKAIKHFFGEAIHVVRKGKAGYVNYLPEDHYTLNDDAYILYLKNDCKYQVSLKWIIAQYRKTFLEYSSSSDNGTWNMTGFFKYATIDIPSYEEQMEIVKEYEKLEKLLEKINFILNHIKIIKSRILSHEYQTYQIKDSPIDETIGCIGGNSGLTEEEIYNRINFEGKKYTVLSSSTEESTRMGEIPKCEIKGKTIKVFEEKDGILVIRNGKAGTALYLKSGRYTTNDHAYILYLKDDCKYQVSLKWIIAQYRKTFLEYSSSSDNGTWNMTGFFEHVTIDIPSYKEQMEIVKEYEKLEILEDYMMQVKQRIKNIFSKQILK